MAGSARGAGRDPSDVSVTTSVILQLNEDRERARREAAYQVAFYSTTRTYTPVLAAHGFDDLVAPLREAHARKDMEAMADIALPMVDTYAIVATTPEEARERLAAFDGVVDRVVLGPAWVGPSQSSIVENYRAILTGLAPAS